MKYKLTVILLLCVITQGKSFSQDEKLMGWSNLSWGMSSEELISSLRGQLDYKTYQPPEIYEVQDMNQVQSIFSNLKNYYRNIDTIPPLLDTLYSKVITGDIFPSDDDKGNYRINGSYGEGSIAKFSSGRNRQTRELHFPGIFQVFGIAVNPLNLSPPLSLVMVLPKDDLHSIENTAQSSPKIYVFIFHKDKLIGSIWTAKKIKNSKPLWEATLKKYGDPEKYFVLTEYHKSGGSGVSFVFASYPRIGLCIQLSFKTYDGSAIKNDLTLPQRYQNGDFTDFGKHQTISIKKECFNFDREPDRAIFSYYYWDPKSVATINNDYTAFKEQLNGTRDAQDDKKASDRANDF